MAAQQTTLVFYSGLGIFEIALDHRRAPQTAGYFLGLAREGLLDGTFIFRIVTTHNNSHNPDCPIHVVQGGLQQDCGVSLPTIDHETTTSTGLSHRKWTVSAARMGVGETYGSFFIALRDEPSLDCGGARHPDGHGFAAFGQVISGFDVLETIFGRAEDREYLRRLIPLTKVMVA